MTARRMELLDDASDRDKTSNDGAVHVGCNTACINELMMENNGGAQVERKKQKRKGTKEKVIEVRVRGVGDQRRT